MTPRWLPYLSALILLACPAPSPAPPPRAQSEEEALLAPAQPAGAESAIGPIAADVAARLARFKPLSITVDESKLDARQRTMLRRLVEAGELMDEIYLRQVDPANPELRRKLAGDPRLADALAYFELMKGPWDRTDPEQRPFIGTRPRPPGGGFYPPGTTRIDIENWVASHGQDRTAFQSFFTVIRRAAGRDLMAVPYSQAYKEWLAPVAQKLREAAALTTDERIRAFLERRAAAFASNDYLESDVAWMDLGDAPFEITIGPYETYDDELMGWKASFEAYIGLRDRADSARLAQVNRYLADIDRDLPLDARYRQLARRGGASPISVVQLLYSAGQGGIHATAYNLPNDERVRKAKGSKKVMLKNIGQAKFDAVTVPIVERLLAPAQQRLVSFEAMFTVILMHEIAHGLGPASIRAADGTEEDVSRALKDLYAPVEEAKADICGLVATQWMIDHGAFPKSLEKAIYASYLAGVFRAVRFGAVEAHARGVLVSYNYLVERGALLHDPATKRFAVDFRKVKDGVRSLAREWLLIEARGERDGARMFLEKYGTVRPEMQAALSSLRDIPIDIRPEFAVLEKMKGW